MTSIIIPTYNGLNLLKKYSIPSLLKQTEKIWEAIIVNDGSKDGTSEFATQLVHQDSRFRLVEMGSNQGLAAALNTGLKELTGDYVFILEHDDIWLPDKLEKQISVLKAGASICTCSAIVYQTKNKKFSKINGGNFSCLSFRVSESSLLFPLPEENKKYLGIEDGVISARIQIAKDKNRLIPEKNIHIEEILTIMNSNQSTLSGNKDSLAMYQRYKSVIDLYTDLKKDHPGLAGLISFWNKHRLYNMTLSLFPFFLRKVIYFAVDKLKEIKTKREINAYTYHSQEKFEDLKKFRQLFD